MSWRGRFFDGNSASRRDAEIAIVPAALHIRPAGGGTVVWPFDRLRWVERPREEGTARLALDDGPARLDVDDAGFVAALRAAWPEIDRAAVKRKRRGRAALIVAAAIAGLAALIYATLQILPSVVTALIPASVERTLGDEVLSRLVRKPCETREGQAAIDRLLMRFAPEDKYVLVVEDTPFINALALPDGRFVVYKGLIDFTKTPEEFASVVAHEIGHAIHRHPTRAVIGSIAISTMIRLFTGDVLLPGVVSTAADFLVSMAYRRDLEQEADDTAATLLKRANISTRGMASLFDRLAARGKDIPEALQLLSTHPRSADRADRIRARGSAGTAPAMPAADWQAIKTMCGTG